VTHLKVSRAKHRGTSLGFRRHQQAARVRSNQTIAGRIEPGFDGSKTRRARLLFLTWFPGPDVSGLLGNRAWSESSSVPLETVTESGNAFSSKVVFELHFCRRQAVRYRFDIWPMDLCKLFRRGRFHEASIVAYTRGRPKFQNGNLG
jgi:hypothetical protein